ncbi:MAG: hydrogenase iron-sulfur subunit [Deltaproteobacteria bacterium]|nr:hydrogenase iron-sulfur subunit [Deltaproteobacteria bacterium]
MSGNYYARRKFAMMKGLLEYMGLEPGRLQFSWISSAESTKFVEVANTVAEEVKALGPAKHFIKEKAEVA